MRIKYPSTPHLPFSPGLQNDDRRITTLEHLEGRRVIATEKLDGENTSMYRDAFHARSLDSQHHSSRDFVKALWGSIAYMIPKGFRVCGENMYAKHSIAYDNLLNYFYGFSVWDARNVALNWDETVSFLTHLELPVAPVLYDGVFDLKELERLADSLDTDRQEGFVVRAWDEVPFKDFEVKFAKWVRKGHVQTDEHWMTQAVVPNKLMPPDDPRRFAQRRSLTDEQIVELKAHGYL